MELTYRQEGDYLIPNLTIDEEPEQEMTKYGLMRKNFLKEHKSGIYQGMLLSGRLTAHCLEMQEQAELAAVTTELDKYENQLKLEIGDIVQQKAEEFGVPVSELLGKNIPLASYLGLTTSELLGEVATPTPGKSPPGLSEDELQVALAYRAADERARSLVDLVLEPWKKPGKLNEAM